MTPVTAPVPRGAAQNVRVHALHAPRLVARAGDIRDRGARPRVVVADDEEATRGELERLLRHEGFDVVLATDGMSGFARVEDAAPDVLVTDLRMPGMDGIELLRRARALNPELVVVVMTGFGDVDTAVRAMKEGAEHYLIKPIQIDELVLLVRRALEKRALGHEAVALRTRLEQHLRFDSIIGTSPAMQDVFDVIEQVAPTKASVLITGESGTGKELVAQAVHERSPRAASPFVKLHCAALAETILESELFGHEKGAFTGAAGRRDGRFTHADGGTLFLDEIGSISPAIQVKLLRFLQERTFERVGGNETIRVDVRIIAATNRDLTADVAAGSFREDLYYRLNVVNIEMPPLRARPGDLVPLANHFLHRFASENGKSADELSEDAVERILAYRWPGNVRELENVMERSVIMCDGTTLTARHLPAGLGGAPKGAMHLPGATLDEVERHAILTTLEACGGRRSAAAQMLGISIRNIQYKLRAYGVAPSRR
jgi:DNA-binding NtrC family response regulator